MENTNNNSNNNNNNNINNDNNDKKEEEEIVVISAPGKVLVTGGYLVLEHPNPGLVLTVNARFYSIIQPLSPSLSSPSHSLSHSHSHSSSSSSSSSSETKIVVVSPQFKSTLEYSLQWDPILSLKPLKEQKENKYVEKTIIVSLQCVKTLLADDTAFQSRLSRGLLIHIVGDNQFYSLNHQLKRLQLPPTAESLQSLPPFLEVQSSLENIPKTGLGSSAALVSSLTGALFSFFNVADFQKGYRTEIVHNAAQLAHSAAQGKIGSGFDISSAVFGSHVYSRFPPEPIMPLLSQLEEGSIPDISLLLSPWNNERKALCLPTGMTLQLGDVGVGSNTPILVRQVLNWRSSKTPDVNETWENLNKSNKLVEEHFAAISALEKENPENYQANLSICSNLPADQWEKQSKLGERMHMLRTVFSEGVRGGMRIMGSKAAVDLEPPSQSRLADATMAVPGCLIAGVPGAGGYDAIVAVVLSKEAGKRVEELWREWKESAVLPLILSEDPVGLRRGPLPAGLSL